MTLDDVVKRLNSLVLLNTKVPQEEGLSVLEKLTPDKSKIFSAERDRIEQKLRIGYTSSAELRKDLRRVHFDLSWVSLAGCSFPGLDFSKVNFSTSNLSGANFSGCDLSGADLSITSLTSTNFSNANLQGANLSLSDCSRATFTGANCSMARFSSCIAVAAAFTGANLSFADFFNSILRNADFSAAMTAGINLENCILEGTIFEYTDTNRDTTALPYGKKEIYQENTTPSSTHQEGPYASFSPYIKKSRYQ